MTKVTLTIAIGSLDEKGNVLKEFIKTQFPIIKWVDFSQNDYIGMATIVGGEIFKSEGNPGDINSAILISGNGSDLEMVVNKCSKIRAVTGYSPKNVEIARTAFNANVLCLGHSLYGTHYAENIVLTFLSTVFEQENKEIVDRINLL